MANTVQHRRGSTSSINSHLGAPGEFVYNTTTKRIHAMDGSTFGGAAHALVSDLDSKANSSVTISAGTGLTGGGSLAANRTIALNSTSIASLSRADTALQALTAGSNITITGSGTSRTIAATAPVTSVAGKTGAVTLVKDDVGLASLVGLNPVVDPQLSRASISAPISGLFDMSDMNFSVQRGSVGDLDQRNAPIMALKKVSDSIELAHNPTFAAVIEKRTTGPNSGATALLAEAVDYAGSAGIAENSFVEGARLMGLVAAGADEGTATGSVNVAACSSGVDYKYLVATEGDVINNFSPSPTYSNFNKNRFAVSFLATSGFGLHRPDAGFMTNPYNEDTSAGYRTGFLVAEDSIDPDGVAFGSRATSVVGLDLSVGDTTYAAIRIRNNRAIRAKNAAGTDDIPLIYLDTSDRVILNAPIGNFSPGFSASGSSFSYSSRVGRWTRVGDIVTVSFRIGLNTSGNTLSTNPLSITGLPFESAADPSFQIFPLEWNASSVALTRMSGGLSSGSTNLNVLGLTTPGFSSIGDLNANSALHATNGSIIWGSFIYKAAPL